MNHVQFSDKLCSSVYQLCNLCCVVIHPLTLHFLSGREFLVPRVSSFSYICRHGEYCWILSLNIFTFLSFSQPALQIISRSIDILTVFVQDITKMIKLKLGDLLILLTPCMIIRYAICIYQLGAFWLVILVGGADV